MKPMGAETARATLITIVPKRGWDRSLEQAPRSCEAQPQNESADLIGLLPFGSSLTGVASLGGSADDASGSGSGAAEDARPKGSAPGVLGAKAPRLSLPPADALPTASSALAILTLIALSLAVAGVLASLFIGGEGAAQRER
jgi:hypothetical protein